jgi:hypothetical protein
MKENVYNLKKQTITVLESNVYLPRFVPFMTDQILTILCINTIQNYDYDSAQLQEKKFSVKSDGRLAGVVLCTRVTGGLHEWYFAQE